MTAELESNVAKIQIGSGKQTNSHVSLLAERSGYGEAELFAIVALPLLNPAASADCERIAAGIFGALRRGFKHEIRENTFETILGQINDEISKLASSGQQNWSSKISAIIAVRSGHSLHIASAGRSAALLMRDGEFNEITENTPASKHPLKTFESYSTGRIKVNDIIILTTSELFNHISLDRLHNILKQNTLEIAAQELVRIVEDTAGPEIALGTLLVHETAPRSFSDSEMDVNDYQKEVAGKTKNFTTSALREARNILDKDTAKKILQKIKLTTKGRSFLSLHQLSKAAMQKSFQGLTSVKNHFGSYKNINLKTHLTSYSSFSRAKKFFLICFILLIIVLVGNVWLAKTRQKAQVKNQEFTEQVSKVEQTLSAADSKLLFKDNDRALSLLAEAKTALSSLVTSSDSQSTAKKDLVQRLNQLFDKASKTADVQVTKLATLSEASHLIMLPNILATSSGKTIVSYNTNTKTTEDGNLRTAYDIQQAQHIEGNQAVIFDGQGLSLWDFARGQNFAPFYQNVPKASGLVDMSRYAINKRVYILDAENGQITSFLPTGNNLSKPTVSVKDPDKLKSAISLAIDGSIYALTPLGISKYNSGKPASFAFPALSPAFSGQGQIFTSNQSKSLYLLDSNGRIIIMDKTGGLQRILKSEELKGATDFYVSESQGLIYVLRSGSLLEVKL